MSSYKDTIISQEEREAMETGDPIVITLHGDLVAWISPEDAEIANYPWQPKESKKKDTPQYYAFARIGKSHFMLHNLVWERMTGTPIHSGYLVDHWNQDKLDNRRCNLRAATRTENEANKSKRRSHKKKDGTTATLSQYKGVTYARDFHRNKPWKAMISKMIDGKTKKFSLGCYFTEREAAEAYNKAAVEMYGEFAYVNKFDDENQTTSGECGETTGRAAD